MKISKQLKIESACSLDPCRTGLHNPYLEGNQLMATDGKKLAVVDIERQDNDIDGYIPRELIKANRATVRKNCVGIISMSEEKASALSKGGEIDVERNPEFNTFPNYKQVLPDSREVVAMVTINPKSLYDLCQALGAAGKDDSVDLIISSVEENGKNSTTPIIVLSDHGFGLQMPFMGGYGETRARVNRDYTRPAK